MPAPLLRAYIEMLPVIVAREALRNVRTLQIAIGGGDAAERQIVEWQREADVRPPTPPTQEDMLRRFAAWGVPMRGEAR